MLMYNIYSFKYSCMFADYVQLTRRPFLGWHTNKLGPSNVHVK